MGLGFALPGVIPTTTCVDDGNEIRVAGEYLFTNLPSPLSAIADPRRLLARPRSPHPLRRRRSSTDTRAVPAGRQTRGTSPFGGGIVFEKAQFDVGFDRSETVKTFSVSAVLRF